MKHRINCAKDLKSILFIPVYDSYSQVGLVPAIFFLASSAKFQVNEICAPVTEKSSFLVSSMHFVFLVWILEDYLASYQKMETSF